jgi:hypothetical protein
MRKAMLLLAILGLVGSLWASDPIIGTWKLNAAKSKFSADFLAFEKAVAPKESTLVVRELDADQIEITETGTGTDGSVISQKGTQPKQGGTVSGFAEGMLFIHTVVSQNERIGTILQNSKQVQVIRWVVSKDGKTLIDTRRSTDSQGKPMEHVIVYDKQ